jgi:hypothetical protein
MNIIAAATRLRAWVACALLAIGVCAAPAWAEDLPSSIVLLPYFEVDLREGIGTRTTLFAICNDGDEPVDLTITVYTNWGIPVFELPLTLEGDQVRTVNLRDWFFYGSLPEGTLSSEQLQHLRAALSGRPSPRDDKFYSEEVAPELAVGAIVFRSADGRDVLWGDSFVLDPGMDFTQGDTLANIDPTVEYPPYCKRHGIRYLLPEGGMDGGTELMIWTRNRAVPSPSPDIFAANRVRAEAEIYNEQGVVIDRLELSLLPVQRLSIQDLGLPERFGWIDLVTEEMSFVVAHYSAPDHVSAAMHAWCLPDELAPPGPSLRLEKLTNGEAADVPTGPKVPVGSTIEWEYVVTNTGDSALFDVWVEDSDGISVVCPGNQLEPGESMSCYATGTAAACQHSNTATAYGSSESGDSVQASDTSHYYGLEEGALSLRALVQGLDANTPPGPEVALGSIVSWTYEVANTGSTSVVELSVTDQHGSPVSCPKTALDPSESMTCTASALAVEGQQSFLATLEGRPACGLDLAVTDPTHYFAPPPAPPAISLVKSTNGQDANEAPGPVLLVGSSVQWTYLVTNAGGHEVVGVTVVDDRVGQVTCPKTVLAPAESMTCTASGVAVAGQYHNLGVATASASDGRSIQATDPSHYLGVSPRLQIEKLVNGFEADDADSSARVLAGGAVLWTYVVTNTGDTKLSSLVVIDDRGATVTCPKTELEPGETMTCTASGTAVTGLYCNLGTATGNAPVGPSVSGSDPACYFGVSPQLTLEKRVQGQDADVPPGPTVVKGSDVQWTYVVTNTGDTALDGLAVTDDQGVSVTCPKTTLQPAESMTCTASGTAIVGQYCNLGTASGDAGVGPAVQATDPACYFGVWPDISVEKLTNGVDADTPPGPEIPVGDPVLWTYVVTNTGDVTLTGVAVTDSRGVAVTCPKTVLEPGETMTCTASGTAEAGQYANVGTASGTPEGSSTVTDTDPSHYKGKPVGDQGCTPGYWKNHTDSWPPTGYSTTQTVVSVFPESYRYPDQAFSTLLQALGFAGGPGNDGAAEILLRAGVAALLNASHPDVDYPRTAADVLTAVNTALTQNRDAMLALAAALDADNNRGCPLN